MNIKKALERGTFFSFIPQHLEISWKPEFYYFPFNIMFMNTTVRDSKKMTGTSLYEPEFHTYAKEDNVGCMRYRNVYGADSFVLIAYDEVKSRYYGKKILKEKKLSSTEAADWRTFFIQLTMLGLSNGEPCKFERE